MQKPLVPDFLPKFCFAMTVTEKVIIYEYYNILQPLLLLINVHTHL